MDTKTVEALVSVGDRYVGRAPTFQVEPGWWSEVEAVTRHLDTLLGVRTVVLRLVHADDAVRGRGGRVVYHVQALDEPRYDVLDATPYADWPCVVAADPLRAPWASVDGPAQLITWAQDVIGPRDAVQVKTWNLSCLIRFPGAWAKATSNFCSLDADIIRLVREYDASLAPAVLGQSTADRWSLLAHAPGTDCWEPDQATTEDVVSRWVAVQALTASDPVAAPEMSPRDVVGQVADLLPRVQLPAADRSELDALIAELPRVVDELEAAGLPITLVHGDFHPGNWRSDGVGRVIVDWADTFVGHPAIDIRRLQDFLPEDRRDHAAQLWARTWQRELPGSDPLRALGPISILSPLTYALTYQRFLDHIEPSERVYHADDPALCLRAALTAWRA